MSDTTVEATGSAAEKTPWHLWVIGVLALLFNCIGAFDWTMYTLRGDAYLTDAGFTAAQVEYYANLPFAIDVVWPLGVWTAVAGSVLLLLRRRWALPVFALSLTVYLLNLLYIHVLSDGGRLLGQQNLVTAVVIAAILLFLIWYSRAMRRRGVLR